MVFLGRTEGGEVSDTKRGISALAGWFGSNRMMAPHVGEALAGCSWAGVVFAGGMSEVPEITARTIVCNDLHRHIINLGRVTASDTLRPQLIRSLRRKVFHPEELAAAQRYCWDNEPSGSPDLVAAENYFVSCWMGRASKAGLIPCDEFTGRPSIRWKADGGDSAVRYFSALRMLGTFAKTLRRCTFETMDAFDFLARCEDLDGHGVYADPPFPEAGRRYKHNAGQTPAEERAWHTRLRDALLRFRHTRIVVRFYDHPLIRELYSKSDWIWREFVGRKQSNEYAPEILLLRNLPDQPGLFE